MCAGRRQYYDEEAVSLVGKDDFWLGAENWGTRMNDEDDESDTRLWMARQ